jgi:Protein of unknown function (DUF4233)
MTDEQPDQPTSGLKNPAAAARVFAAATLILEAITLLLAIQPIRIMAPDTPAWGLAVIAGLAVMCIVFVTQLKRAWVWHAGTALQVAVIATGFLQYAMFVLGVVFLGAWLYVLKVRSDITKPARFDH